MMNIGIRKHNTEYGAVSLFVVIFTALLVTTITISFVQLMVRDQRQAMYSDLSESAYDSATAGVEDAKRALLIQQECIGNDSPYCNDVRSAIRARECTTLSRIFDSGSGERAIIQTEGDRRLEQAYTCVKITQDTSDYLGIIDQNTGAAVIPLRGTDAFNKVMISWALNREGSDITLPPMGTVALPKEGGTWPDSYPALLRTQFIYTGETFRLSDFNSGSHSRTLFLYPSSAGTLPTDVLGLGVDGRRDAANGAPQPIACNEDVESGAYACQVTIDLGYTVAANSQAAFLNLMAFYNVTDYKIELLMADNADPIPFSGVQPEVDSTGRANDLFRRVVSRVELGSTFNYPVAALETKNDICKNFSVTTEPDGYSVSSQCIPEGN